MLAALPREEGAPVPVLQDPHLGPDFESVTEPDEEILWRGKPVFWPFVLHAAPILALGAVWGAFDLGLLRKAFSAAPGELDLALITFAALHSFPAWGSVLYALYLAVVHGNTVYAYSNRRLLIRSGVVGTSFRTVDYDSIQELDVTVGILERLFGVGTLRAYAGRNTAKGARLYDQFVSIAHPYDVYRAIKGVELDVKTDWSYPNALRPATNPGYRSELKPNA
ncbi:MAG TPA: PH domain-containing protein [Stellaceae bacterium]|nr:PH domain-containing protein [Stellaceae bacterium]